MAHKASRRGAVNLGMPLMIVAFLIMLGFLYWLFLQSQAQKAEEAVQMQEAAAEKASTYPDAASVTGGELQQDASPLVGKLVKVEPLSVASKLGTQGFWLNLPNNNPFLVSLDDSLRADSISVQAGEKVMVVGTIRAMSDSAVNSWVSSGTIGEGDKLAAEFATHYLQAVHVQVMDEGVPAGAGPGDGGGGI
ncbi:MAG: hypothetical protein LJF04_10055 [Gemmatimonadetes bacterium]|nr:hypothetical protein [Gemmatimonadota bacterium]